MSRRSDVHGLGSLAEARPQRFGIALALALGVAILFWSPAIAVEVPPAGSPLYIQTNGPSAGIGMGDWYTAQSSQGGGGGYHYLSIYIPCGWPSNLQVHIDLYSPEMVRNDPADEMGGGSRDNTVFELYAPGTPYMMPGTPGPGAPGSLHRVQYAPRNQGNAYPDWRRFYTLAAPVTCGSYLLRAETQGDDQNGWRLRAGSDNDANPNNTPPANYDDPDGIPGTGDEILVSTRHVSYQHDTGSTVCMTLNQYIPVGEPSVTFHNFDMDNNGRVRYYAPSASYDPQGQTSGIAGTVSGDRVWNNGTTSTRVGDTIADPEPGWWRIVTCISHNNQYIQEGNSGLPTYSITVPVPALTLSLDNGVSTVQPTQPLTYTLGFENVSNTTSSPGAAKRVVLENALPSQVDYEACEIRSPFTGECVYDPDTHRVTVRIDQVVIAGASGIVHIRTRVRPAAGGQLVAAASLTYQDAFENVYPTGPAMDRDDIQPTAVTLASFGVMPVDGGFEVQWETAMELDNAGFNLYRSTSVDRDYIKVNTELIVPQYPGQILGASYTWLDRDVEPDGVYFYKLEDIDLNGTATLHGPISTIPNAVGNLPSLPEPPGTAPGAGEPTPPSQPGPTSVALVRVAGRGTAGTGAGLLLLIATCAGVASRRRTA